MIWSLSKICALNITDSLTNVCKVVCCVANMLQYRQLFNVFEYRVWSCLVYYIKQYIHKTHSVIALSSRVLIVI